MPIRQFMLRSCAAIIAVVGAASIVGPVAAQERIAFSFSAGGPMRGDASFEPAMTERQFQSYSDVLMLDETQRIVADELLADYRGQFSKKAEDVQEKMADLRDEANSTGDFGVFGRELGPLLEQWVRDKQALERELLDTLKLLLNENQIARWPIFEREKRRNDALPHARLSGEEVDMIDLVRGLKLDEATTARLEPLLEQYATELDSALQARDAAIPELEQKMFQSMQDKEEATRIWEEGTRKREVVRDINVRTLQIVSSELSDEKAAELADAFRRRAYPLVYETTKADRVLEAARSLDTLNDNQVAQLDQVEAEFQTRMAILADRLISEVIKKEAGPPPFFDSIGVEAPNSRPGREIRIVVPGAAEDEEYGGLLKERFDLSKSTVELVYGVLTAEQKDALPSIDTSDNNGFLMRGLRLNL